MSKRAEEYLHQFDQYGISVTSWTWEDMVECYDDSRKQAEEDLGWHSVKDKLPGPSEWVVACIEQHGHAQCLTLATYNEETKVWHTDNWEDGEQETYNPDYWMPIPNRIKEAKK